MPTGAVRHGVDAVDGGFGSVDDVGDPVDGGCRIPDDLCCRVDHLRDASEQQFHRAQQVRYPDRQHDHERGGVHGPARG